MFAAAAEAAAAANSGGTSLASSRCSSAAPTLRVSEQGAEVAPSPGKHHHQQQQQVQVQQQEQQQVQVPAAAPGGQPRMTSRAPAAVVSSGEVLDSARRPDQGAAAAPCTTISDRESHDMSGLAVRNGASDVAAGGSAPGVSGDVLSALGMQAQDTSSSAQQQQQQQASAASLLAANLPHLLVLPHPEEGPASPPASPASACSRSPSSSSSGLGGAEEDQGSSSSSPCGSSSSLDDEVLMSLHVPAQGGVGEVLLQMGVSVDSGAMRVARVQQQALMMRRHQQQQQALEALRSRQHLEQQQRQQLAAHVMGPLSPGEGQGEAAAAGMQQARPSHRPREGSGRLGTRHGSLSQLLLDPVRRLSSWRLPDMVRAGSSRALGSTSADSSSRASGAVVETEVGRVADVVEGGSCASGGAGEPQAGGSGLEGLPREPPTPGGDLADLAFPPGHFYAARHAATTTTAAAAGGGGLQGIASGGSCVPPAAEEEEEDGASMYSIGQQSGVSWSTNSQVNRTPRLEWWGREGRYFSGRTPRDVPEAGSVGLAGAGGGNGGSSSSSTTGCQGAALQAAAAASDGISSSSSVAAPGHSRSRGSTAPTHVGSLVAGVTKSVTRAVGPRLHQVTRYVLGVRGGRSSSTGGGTSSGREGSDRVGVEAGGPSGTAAAAHQ
jgi:hypothetical protein